MEIKIVSNNSIPQIPCAFKVNDTVHLFLSKKSYFILDTRKNTIVECVTTDEEKVKSNLKSAINLVEKKIFEVFSGEITFKF